MSIFAWFFISADTEAPVILNCPNATEIFLFGDRANVRANWTRPTITDNSGNFSLDVNLMSGDVFPLGTKEVVINATDAAGNSAICAFNVTVLGESECQLEQWEPFL